MSTFIIMDKRTEGKVLVCPLDWGLGHATRCVPIINVFLKQGRSVVLAADGDPLAFLRQEFGERLAYYRFPGKTIRYPLGNRMMVKILIQLPVLLWSVIKEHLYLKRLVRETGANLVISDNRYGLWNKKIYSVLITHQLFIRAPANWKWAEPVLWKWVHWHINRFDQCWVPDFSSEPGLAGELSHGSKYMAALYIGPLSRFSEIPEDKYLNPLPEKFPRRFFLVILSGPEPQRSLLEEKLRNGFDDLGEPVVFVLGKPGSFRMEQRNKRLMFSHVSSFHLAWLIRNALMVVCRSGYSSIMDLSVFGKKALLVPTPGQTEQEYLGDFLKQQGQAYCVRQEELNLSWDLAEAEKYLGIRKTHPQMQLMDELPDLLKFNGQ